MMNKVGKQTPKMSKCANTETLGIVKPILKDITKTVTVWRTCCVKAGVQWKSSSKDAVYKHKKRYPECPYLKEKA